jgi:hypothetical protein
MIQSVKPWFRTKGLVSGLLPSKKVVLYLCDLLVEYSKGEIEELYTNLIYCWFDHNK